MNQKKNEREKESKRSKMLMIGDQEKDMCIFSVLFFQPICKFEHFKVKS